jgi:hypothetical protein
VANVEAAQAASRSAWWDVVGAAAGLVGSALHAVLDRADAFRDAAQRPRRVRWHQLRYSCVIHPHSEISSKILLLAEVPL